MMENNEKNIYAPKTIKIFKREYTIPERIMDRINLYVTHMHEYLNTIKFNTHVIDLLENETPEDISELFSDNPIIPKPTADALCKILYKIVASLDPDKTMYFVRKLQKDRIDILIDLYMDEVNPIFSTTIGSDIFDNQSPFSISDGELSYDHGDIQDAHKMIARIILAHEMRKNSMLSGQFKTKTPLLDIISLDIINHGDIDPFLIFPYINKWARGFQLSPMDVTDNVVIIELLRKACINNPSKIEDVLKIFGRTGLPGVDSEYTNPEIFIISDIGIIETIIKTINSSDAEIPITSYIGLYERLINHYIESDVWDDDIMKIGRGSDDHAMHYLNHVKIDNVFKWMRLANTKGIHMEANINIIAYLAMHKHFDVLRVMLISNDPIMDGFDNYNNLRELLVDNIISPSIIPYLSTSLNNITCDFVDSHYPEHMVIVVKDKHSDQSLVMSPVINEDGDIFGWNYMENCGPSRSTVSGKESVLEDLVKEALNVCPYDLARECYDQEDISLEAIDMIDIHRLLVRNNIGHGINEDYDS